MMEPSCIRLRAALFLTFLFAMPLLATANAIETNPTDEYDYDEAAVVERLMKLENDIVKPRYTPAVKSYILTYFYRKPEKAQMIIGRSALFFPMFEEYLRKAGLPQDLKYLSVVESALIPTAVSRAGAVGLWQFMPTTARWLGLEIDSYVDERRDPHKSTKAAIEFLNHLYERFGDWELAIAAYNSGGGRVSRAIKRARSKDFWKIQPYLPRETRNYVPAFIAAYYLMQQYEHHKVVPTYPDLDMQLTKTITVYGKYTFDEIAGVTNLPVELIQELNPAYLQGLIPENTRGHYLTLPNRVIPAFEDYVRTLSPDQDNNRRISVTPIYAFRPGSSASADYVRSLYTVQPGESLASLAREIGCTVNQIRAWNKLSTPNIRSGQQLILFHAPNNPRFGRSAKLESMAPLATLMPPAVIPTSPIWVLEQKRFITKGGYIYYLLHDDERVFDVAQKFPEVSVKDLMYLNGFKKTNQLLKKDSYVRIKKL